MSKAIYSTPCREQAGIGNDDEDRKTKMEVPIQMNKENGSRGVTDRELPVAYGSGAWAKTWSNKTTTFEELVGRFHVPTRTTETAAEYAKMTKTERGRVKDRGGFVAGHLKDGRRLLGNVTVRSMLVYDIDGATAEFLAGIRDSIPNRGCFYSTHSHTPEAPRIRLIIPATRDMTPDECSAVARHYASDNGFLGMLDPCSFRANQMMYWPTCPADGEYLFGETEGEWLDPDEILRTHPDWEDCATLPTAPGEDRAVGGSARKQKDPLAKEGVVGAFCRTYTIHDAMEKFLSDVYAPTATDDRYDYIPGEGYGGVVLYGDVFAYSNHATDPAYQRLCNAFDLVRIHKFGDMDDDADPGTPPGRMPSYQAMKEFALRQDEVKVTLTNERIAGAGNDFSQDDDEWKKKLQYTPRSTVLQNSVWNEVLILENDGDYANFAYNEMANRVQITGPVPWERPSGNPFWRDADTAQLKARLDMRYVPFSERNHAVSFTKVVDDRHFHPVRDYLDGLPEWDGSPRVDDLFIRWLQADDNRYVRAVTRKTLVAGVRRIYEPGTKFDTITVLDGAQGIGKSTAWRVLAGDEYFSDALTLTDMDDKSGAEKLQGFWFVEIGELAGMKKADIEKVKSFLSTLDDKYRPSYGKTVENHPRQCIVVATVNGERGYLRDITGNRRFWIVKCRKTDQKVDWALTPEERDQIWAEAKYYYGRGESLELDSELLQDAEEVQRSAMEADDRQGMVEEYLAKLLPEDWAKMDIGDRRIFLDGGTTITKKGTVPRTEVSNAEIWCECFGRNLADLRPADSYAIAALMVQVGGWERTGAIRRQPIYGRQRIYQKED